MKGIYRLLASVRNLRSQFCKFHIFFTKVLVLYLYYYKWFNNLKCRKWLTIYDDARLIVEQTCCYWGLPKSEYCGGTRIPPNANGMMHIHRNRMFWHLEGRLYLVTYTHIIFISCQLPKNTNLQNLKWFPPSVDWLQNPTYFSRVSEW